MLSTSCGNTYLAWSPDGNSFATKNENDVLTLYDFRKMRAAKHSYKSTSSKHASTRVNTARRKASHSTC
ncbi:hypothetical protein HaLaN_15539 [Haematococcus lacustris]|uniref:WD_REPEATS_REGION domain-containing protein n=1 Tax=Haematococcus lacustris TaxID=44745 RepID=A0A699Z935_HAELA|nr:hypothetical protein HaLaN_15539 [Haematococcus lacustris]